MHYIKHERRLLPGAEESSALITVFDGNPLTALLIALIGICGNNIHLAGKKRLFCFIPLLCLE